MAEPSNGASILRSLVIATLPLARDEDLQRELAAWLTSPASVDEHVPPATLAYLFQLGLVCDMGSGDKARLEVTPLGQHYLSSVEAGNDVRERLEELERLRTEFLSAVAHELRTPLTSVRTSVGLLMDPDIHSDPETHQTLLENISHSADRMQHLVNDLLDLARFRSGHIQLQVLQFDARDVARAGVDAVNVLARQKRQRLNLTLPGRALRLFGDRWRIEQALINLLSNASKFSPVDSSIGLTLRSVGPDVEWSVSDEGPGIQPEDMDRLFERFFTRRWDTSGWSSGAGLGLPIALAIAQAHDGTIVVESQPEQGSTFRLRVPKKPSEEPSA